MRIQFREAHSNDIYDIYNLNKQCLPLYYSYIDLLMFMLLFNKYLVYVCHHKNTLIGYLIGKYNDKNFHILSLGIENKYRSKGIGTHFLKALVQKVKPYCNTITLFVHDENIKGINFYKKNKFEIVKTISNYYSGYLRTNSQNALLMKKSI